MRFLPLIFLASLLQANEVPPVHYWSETAGVGWLAVTSQQDEAARLTLIRPDGQTGPDFSALPIDQPDSFELRELPERILPTSPWWHRHGALQDMRNFTKDQPSAFQWLQSQASAELQSLNSATTAQANLPTAFRRIAEAVPLETTDPQVKAHGLSFTNPDYTLPDALLNLRFQQIHLNYDLGMRRYEAADPAFADRPAEIVHELRLLHATPDHCSALIITRARRKYSSTSVTLHSIHLKRDSDDTWNFYDPLDAITDSAAFAQAIDRALSQFDYADADFSKKHPDPLSPKTRQLYTPLQIGPRLYLLFEPYTIAAGAFGVVTVCPES